MSRYDWHDAAEPPALLRLPVTSASTLQVVLERGATYRISAAAALPDGYSSDAKIEGYVPASAEPSQLEP